jgi:hypothetical protein
VVGEVVDAGGQLRLIVREVVAGTGERADETGRVVLAERLHEGRAGFGRETVDRGDLAGELAEVGGVAAGPGGDGTVAGPPVTGGLDALFAGGAGRSGTQAQIAALGGLPAGDAEGVGQVGPAGARWSRTSRSTSSAASAWSGLTSEPVRGADCGAWASRTACSIAASAASAARKDAGREAGSRWSAVMSHLHSVTSPGGRHRHLSSFR